MQIAYRTVDWSNSDCEGDGNPCTSTPSTRRIQPIADSGKTECVFSIKSGRICARTHRRVEPFDENKSIMRKLNPNRNHTLHIYVQFINSLSVKYSVHDYIQLLQNSNSPNSHIEIHETCNSALDYLACPQLSVCWWWCFGVVCVCVNCISCRLNEQTAPSKRTFLWKQSDRCSSTCNLRILFQLQTSLSLSVHKARITFWLTIY